MALQWANNPTMLVKFDVATNANGNIKTDGQTAAGKKTVTLPGVKADATFAEANSAYNAIFGGIFGATYNEMTGQRVITGGVVDDGE